MNGKVLNWEVKRRTFEGKENPEANNNPLTSKYMPSQKYIALYKVQWDHGGISDMNTTYKTKSDAVSTMEFKAEHGIEI